MKFDTDTEIDRLLRRQARRKGTAASTATGAEHEIRSDDENVAAPRAGGAHLDADEMNAFAEGMLPDASRARYFAHLADCDECRGLVAQLTLAANVAAAPGEKTAAAVAASPARSWRDWLSALFAPAVLRYAVPALALLAVTIVVFVATRERREANLVAQNEQVQSSKPVTTPSSDDASAARPTTATTDTTVTQNKGIAANTNAVAGKVEGERETDSFSPAATPPPPQKKQEGFTEQESPAPQGQPKPAERPDPLGLFTDRAKDADGVLRVGKAEPPPPPVANVPATKTPVDDKRAADEESAQKTADTNEKNKASAPSSVASSSGLSRTQAGAQVNGQRAPESSRREGPAARRGRSSDNQLSRDGAGADAKEDRAAETRSVGGRQFRRQGGAWIDTAYSPSRATISVTRGSEQYRALVADEPGIRTIADQLNGTVIIVWKNRAYRIY